MSSQGNNINLFKQPTNSKIKQLTTNDLVSEEPLFKPFLNLFLTQKPRVKKLNNHELLQVPPFYDVINVLRKARAFKKYAETCEVEIINKKSLNDSLSVSKNSIKNLSDEFLREKKAFKYVLSTKIILTKRTSDNEHTFSTVYFNSLVRAAINRRYHLNESFEKILNLLDAWINESSA